MEMENYMIISEKPRLTKVKNRSTKFKMLKRHAQKQKSKIIKHLKKHGLMDSVEHIGSPTVFNMLAITCDPNIIDEIKRIPNVKDIIVDVEIEVELKHDTT